MPSPSLVFLAALGSAPWRRWNSLSRGTTCRHTRALFCYAPRSRCGVSCTQAWFSAAVWLYTAFTPLPTTSRELSGEVEHAAGGKSVSVRDDGPSFFQRRVAAEVDRHEHEPRLRGGPARLPRRRRGAATPRLLRSCNRRRSSPALRSTRLSNRLLLQGRFAKRRGGFVLRRGGRDLPRHGARSSGRAAPVGCCSGSKWSKR